MPDKATVVRAPLAERVALITGANSGLGEALSGILAAQGVRVFMVVRDLRRGEDARQRLRAKLPAAAVEVLVADLRSQAAIRALAASVIERAPVLHFLVNNAGSAFPQRQLTEDGIEASLAVNHLAPYLLTRLLLEPLSRAGESRVVNVGTRMNTAMDFDDLHWERRPYSMMAAYGQAKLGHLHLTRELARRLGDSGPRVNCVFPGVFNSNLGRQDGAWNALWQAVAFALGWALPSPRQAAERVMYALCAPELAERSGLYLGGRRELPVPAQAADPAANARLWEISAALTGLPLAL